MLKSYVMKGIPDTLRGDVWKFLLRVDELKAEKPTIFEDCIKNIVKDISLSRSTSIYLPLNKKAALELCVGSFYHYIGHVCCSLSNVISNNLLVYMNTKDAFYALLRVDSLCTISCHSAPSIINSKVLNVLIDELLPIVANQFNCMSVCSEMFSVKWFLGIFAFNRLSFTYVMRIWDLVFYYGDEILFATAIVILRLMQDKLKVMKFEEAMLALNDITDPHINVDSFVKLIEKERNRICDRLCCLRSLSGTELDNFHNNYHTGYYTF